MKKLMIAAQLIGFTNNSNRAKYIEKQKPTDIKFLKIYKQ
jgi:hypothetical protein